MNEGVRLGKSAVYFDISDRLEGATPKPTEMKPYSPFKDEAKDGPGRTKRWIVVRYSVMKRIWNSFMDCSLPYCEHKTYRFFRALGKKHDTAGQSSIQQTLAKPKMQHKRC